MTREETTSILSIIKAAYPRSYAHMKSADAAAVLNLWAMQFKDDDYSLVSAAVQAYISSNTSGFEPSPGQIREKMRLLSSPKRMTAAEAWNIVLQAAKKAYYKPAPAFKSLPPQLQIIIGNWESLESIERAAGTDLEVKKSNFIRLYNEQSAHDEELAALPETVQQYRTMMLSQAPANDTKQLC